MRLVAYLRVSTDRQAEEGLGLDIQRAGIRSWAKTNGHRISEWTADEGISGSNGVESRRGLLDALTAIEDRRASGLVVYRLDRLARQLTVQEGTLAQVWSMGAQVFSVDHGEIAKDDPDDPMRTALRQMVGVFAQLERGMIGARLRAGRRLKAERGGFAYGSPPFGYRVEEGELVPDGEETQAIKRIRELHAQRLSLRSISRQLHEEGISPKRAQQWSPETLRRIIART